MTDAATIRLFSYGTLQQPEVQRSTFGRLLDGAPDSLPGFAVETVEITDEAVVAASGKRFHPIVMRSGDPADRVEGTAFLITPAELAAADDYEVDDYRRIAVTLASGWRRSSMCAPDRRDAAGLDARLDPAQAEDGGGGQEAGGGEPAGVLGGEDA